jgi:ribonuclease T2
MSSGRRSASIIACLPHSKSAWPVLLALALTVACAACDTGERERNRPGDFDYYVLVLSWSPAYCNIEGRKRHEDQCKDGRGRAFTLHGLWPQYERGWPQDCRISHRPFVPQPLIDQMSDIMPGRGLVIHEYRAHGTCSGLEPERYFATARELFQRVVVPPPFRQSDKALELSLAEIENDFLDANAWMKPDMIAISCRDGQLLDIRVCFDQDLAPRACGANENQRGLCKRDRIVVPPADN